MNILDRTLEPRPLLVTQDTDMSDTVLVDSNTTRPAVVVTSGTLRLGAGYRTPHANYADPADPGLDKTFDGTFLPKLAIGFSNHDFTRAFVALLGNSSLDCQSLSSPTCALVLPNPDGSYGVGQHVTVGELSGRFGVMFAGQKDFIVTVGKSTQDLTQDVPYIGAGHAVYANEVHLNSTGAQLPAVNVKVRLGHAYGKVMAPMVRIDHVTAKFKLVEGVDYECLDDQNPCSALDQFGSSGFANIRWAPPKTFAQNGSFLAFRMGTDDTMGAAKAKFCLKGSFDASNCPDQSVPVCRVETPLSAFAGCQTKGGNVGVFWSGTDVRGLTKTNVIDN